MLITFAVQVSPRSDEPPNMAGTKVIDSVSGCPFCHRPATACDAVTKKFSPPACPWNSHSGTKPGRCSTTGNWNLHTACDRRHRTEMCDFTGVTFSPEK